MTQLQKEAQRLAAIYRRCSVETASEAFKQAIEPLTLAQSQTLKLEVFAILGI